MKRMELVQPPDWPPPKGYANGVAIRGRTLFIAGQIGWDAAGKIVSRDLAAQFAQALDNVLAVVGAPRGAPGARAHNGGLGAAPAAGPGAPPPLNREPRDRPALPAPAPNTPRGGARAAGAAPEDLAKMTVFVTDLDAYRSSLRAIGQAWKARLGKHFPAMALVGVAGLVEEGAVVEIEAVAVLEDP